MSKYIDKDKVLEYIIFGVVSKDITCGELKRGIESLPTIDIIRCSECKFWDRDNVSSEGRALCQTGESGYRARPYYDFCSKAIRNEDERNER